jgi:hypothetical protein
MFFIILYITTVITSNTCAFKEFLCLLSVLPNSTASWRMRVIYTSKGLMEIGTCEEGVPGWRLGRDNTNLIEKVSSENRVLQIQEPVSK